MAIVAENMTNAVQLGDKMSLLSINSSWSSSDAKIVRLTHTWSIYNISNCLTWGSGELETGPFSSTDPEVTTWKLKMIKNKYNNTLFVQLCLVEARKPIRAGFTFYVNDKEDSTTAKHLIVGRDKWFQNGVVATNFGGWKDYFAKYADPRTGNLPGDSMLVTCVIHMKNIVRTECGNFTLNKKPSCTMVADLGILLKEGRFYDAVIQVGSKIFPVHKGILSIRSVVFAAMFSHDTLETRENKVVVTDITEDTMAAILQYMYTGNITDLAKNAQEILCAADKYMLHDLKTMCEIELLDKMNEDNVSSLFLLATRHSIDTFKFATVDFIVKNYDAVTKTRTWFEMVAENPGCLVEILNICFDKKSTNSINRGMIGRNCTLVKFL